MPAAKFCTDWSLEMFFSVMFDHAVEQHSNLLKTKELIVHQLYATNLRKTWHAQETAFPKRSRKETIQGGEIQNFSV